VGLLAQLAEQEFYGHYGDYLAILNHEPKCDKLLDGLQFRTGDFLSSTKKLAAEIEVEDQALEEDEAAPTPILDSIAAAYKIVFRWFSSPEHIVHVFKSYAKRNTLFHTEVGVKELAGLAEPRHRL
jgi:hypothetical protein